MPIAEDFLLLHASESTLTQNPQLLSATAPNNLNEQGQSRFNAPNFAGLSGRLGYRILFGGNNSDVNGQATVDLSGYKFIKVGGAFRNDPWDSWDTFANNGVQFLLVDDLNNYKGWTVFGKDLLEENYGNAVLGYANGTNDAREFNNPRWVIEISAPATVESTTPIDLTRTVGIECHVNAVSPISAPNRAFAIGGFYAFNEEIVTGSETLQNIRAVVQEKPNPYYDLPHHLFGENVLLTGGTGNNFALMYGLNIGDGSTPTTINITNDRLLFNPSTTSANAIDLNYSFTVTNQKEIVVNQSATCSFILDNAIVEGIDDSNSWKIQLIGNTSGEVVARNGTVIRGGELELTHGDLSDTTFSRMYGLTVSDLIPLTDIQYINAPSGNGITFTGDGGDYSDRTIRFNNNTGDDLTLGSGGNTNPYDFSGITVPDGYTLKIYNNSLNDITVVLPQGLVTSTRTDGGNITIVQPQATTDVTVINLTNTSVLLRNNLGATVDFQQGVTGTYQFTIPATESGTWSIRLDRQGFRRRTTDFEADGTPKDFGGVLEELLNFDGSPKYTATSSAQITIDAVNEKIIVREGFITGQIVYNMIQDASITQAGMEDDNIARIDFAKASFGNDFQLGIWQFLADPALTGNAFITEANIFHDTSEPFDTANGNGVSFNGGIQVSVSASATPAEIATATRIEMEANGTSLDTVLENTNRVDGLIENINGDRLTAKALELASGGSGLDESTFHSYLLSAPTTTKEAYHADTTSLATQASVDTIDTNLATVQGIITNNLDTTVSSRSTFDSTQDLVTANITQVQGGNVTIANFPTTGQIEGALLNEGDGQQLIDAIVTTIGNQNVDEIALVALIRSDLERNGGLLNNTFNNTSTLVTGQTTINNNVLSRSSQSSVDNIATAIGGTLIANVTQVNGNNVTIDDFKADSVDLSTVITAIDNLNDLSLGEIEASNVLAKEATVTTVNANVLTRSSQASVNTLSATIGNLPTAITADINANGVNGFNPFEKKLLLNTQRINNTTNQLETLDDDNLTVIATSDLFDDNGIATSEKEEIKEVRKPVQI